MSGKSTYEPSLALLTGLVCLVVIAQLLWLYLPQTTQTLGDSDDAMRLVEVRNFLAGRFQLKLPDGGVPYPILIYVGMLPWQFFSSALTNAGQSVLSNAQLITKVYFPRLIVPAAAVITVRKFFGTRAV